MTQRLLCSLDHREQERFLSKNKGKNLLSGPLKSRFLLALPWILSFAQEQVERGREGRQSRQGECFNPARGVEEGTAARRMDGFDKQPCKERGRNVKDLPCERS
jgi:hypothetical protein